MGTDSQAPLLFMTSTGVAFAGAACRDCTIRARAENQFNGCAIKKQWWAAFRWACSLLLSYLEIEIVLLPVIRPRM
jgi:hypothetical protein